MTTEQQTRRAAPTLMVFPFPVPGNHVRLAYRELRIAINGTEEQRKALGNHALLPRPWEPASCLDPKPASRPVGVARGRRDLAQPRVHLGRLRPHPQPAGPCTRTWSTRSPSWPTSAGEPAWR
ncbi:hypothetical protein G5V59_18935 [Nocardioides sp. W3-2-3]|uniref:hypothetical protein n=1 Tax=Nocardioides convexus TaxID=2712224 RepID=UPI0024186893|nr:hypothetical protein [Nocardioides convexus]NHA01228.1 hypothetical protein [Nocardioides convexus]